MKIFTEFVRYATLAPNSHNTQCWKFDIGKDSITVLPDVHRKCPVVDPDDHHLFVSLGCAVENIVVAAKAHGFDTKVDTSSPGDGIRVDLKNNDDDNPLMEQDALFRAINHRQTTRSNYNGQELPLKDLDQLAKAGTGDGVQVKLLTTTEDKETIKTFVTRANSVQLNDPLFKTELKSWVRFNGREAASLGDGLFGKCMGHPSVPRWLGGLIFDYGVTESSENAKIVNQIDSSAGVAVFVSNNDDQAHWVEVGRCFERFALTATSLGVQNAHLNQPVEVATVRPAFAEALGLGKGARPDLVIRFGYGSNMPRSCRRPLEDVLVDNSLL